VARDRTKLPTRGFSILSCSLNCWFLLA